MSNFSRWQSGTALLMVLGMTASTAAPIVMLAPAFAQTTSFPDVSSDYWAKGFIEALAAREIIKGFPDGRFKPDDPVTRAEFAAMVLKAFEKPAINNDSTFVDVSSNFWASSAIRKANTTGFLKGYPGNVFRPSQNIPRVEVLVSLANGLQYKAISSTTNVLQAYRDATAIPEYARNSVSAATEKGIVVNYADINLLNPTRRATRAEVAAFIYQALVSTGQAQAVPSSFIVSSTGTSGRTVTVGGNQGSGAPSSGTQAGTQGGVTPPGPVTPPPGPVTPPSIDDIVINNPPTDEKPPLAVVNEPSDEYQPITSLDVYVPNPSFNNQIANTTDISSSSEPIISSLSEQAPIPQSWIDFFIQSSPEAVAFQPISSIIKSGSQDLSAPVSTKPSTLTLETLTPGNTPSLGSSKPGAVINSVIIDHNLQFDQATRGMAIRVTSTIWNSKDASGSINIYVKRADGSYVRSKDSRYASQGQGLLTSGVGVKIPSDNTRAKGVVYLPYTAFDLPSGKTTGLQLQVQVRLGTSSFASANDQGSKFDITTGSQTQQPSNRPLPNRPRAVAFLINGYGGTAHPNFVRQVLEAEPTTTWPYKLSNGQPVRGLGIPTIVGNWDDLYSETTKITLRSDDEFRRQMRMKLRQVPPDVPVILIGHSFGADSLLQVAQCEAGNNASCPPNLISTGANPPPSSKILFLGALDGTEFGGIRTRKTSPNNVDYFFNRWTSNPFRATTRASNVQAAGVYTVISALLGPPGVALLATTGIPLDSKFKSGTVKCESQPGNCDQTEQSLARTWDSNEIRVACEVWEVTCPGYRLAVKRKTIGRGRWRVSIPVGVDIIPGTKAQRVDHGGLPNDMYVQRQIIEALTKLLPANTKPPLHVEPPVVKPPSTPNRPPNTSLNRQPVANNDTATTLPGRSVSINVLDNDRDPNRDQLTISNVTQGRRGKVGFSSNGTVNYTPNAGFSGPSDSFSYTISDGKDGTASATVTVNVQQPPQRTTRPRPPEANDDTATVKYGWQDPVTINVLANDSASGNGKLTVTGVTQGTLGTVELNTDGSVSYTPNAGFTGSNDHFTYTISNGQGGTDTATVTVTVEQVPPPADEEIEANDDNATTQSATPITINVLANDIPSDGISVTEVKESNNGIVEATDDGIIKYKPNDDFSGTDSFTYTIRNDRDKTATATVTVTVEQAPQTNKPPVANNDTATVAPYGSVTIEALSNDNDPDGDKLTLTNFTQGAKGSVSNQDGTLTYSPGAGIVNTDDTFTYTISDGKGETATATVTLTIQNFTVPEDGMPTQNTAPPVEETPSLEDTTPPVEETPPPEDTTPPVEETPPLEDTTPPVEETPPLEDTTPPESD